MVSLEYVDNTIILLEKDLHIARDLYYKDQQQFKTFFTHIRPYLTLALCPPVGGERVEGSVDP